MNPKTKSPPTEPVGNVRRSKRVAQMMLRRSSSLGEESDTSHFQTSTGWQKQTRLNGASNCDFSPKTARPLFTLGVIADIQYAPIPDGHSYGGVPRYYRHALDTARHAAQHFEQDCVSLVLNLGDTVDGKCQELVKHGGEEVPRGVDPGHAAVDDVVNALSIYQSGPIIHTYGNHELYNLNRVDIGTKLGIPFVKEPCGDLVGYRSYAHDNIRFVVLDTYDLAITGRCPQSSRKYKEASKLLAENNPNFPEAENSPEGLEGLQKRYVAFNGAVDKPQLAWLKDTLEKSRDSREKVIVVSHQPILPGSSSPVCLVWNYKELLQVLRDYSDIVVASFSGHAHKGGYKRDETGIHFRVFEAVLENPHPHKTYAFVDIFDDRLEVRGVGGCTSAIYDFEHTVAAPRTSAIEQAA